MIHYPKLIQIILNFTEIEALPKYIRNKSSEIQNLFSAEIPALVATTNVLSMRRTGTSSLSSALKADLDTTASVRAYAVQVTSSTSYRMVT